MPNTNNVSEKKYDAIIIGSGMGSLTTASVLAQLEGKRVLVLERHFQAGGYTHVFRRKRKYMWDVGLHYVGGVGEGGELKSAFDFITKGKLKWNAMPDPYDTFVYPGLKFSMRNGEKNVKADLVQAFPAEEQAINQYFKDLKKAINWFRLNEVKKNAPAFIRWALGIVPHDSQFALQTVKSYLDKTFQDEKIKAVLVSQWGDYGLPPGKAPFAIHALLTSHYFDGAFYPIGGSENIFDNILPIIEENGGDVLVNHRVDEIIIENGKAVGVRATNTRARADQEAKLTFKADTIISGAGAYITYMQLIDKSVPLAYRDKIASFDKRNPCTAHLSLYLGLKESPEKLGFKGENHWIFSDFDHDGNFDERNDWIQSKKPFMAYLSFPSLKDPEATSHTAEIITFADYENFSKWKDQPWKKRDHDYKTLKEDLSDGLINFVNERYEGFADLIEYRELSTPLSTEYMTGHHRGTIYGLAGTPERFDFEKSPWCQVQTPFKNLYLTGTEASAWGISGAMVGGLMASIHLLKPYNVPKVLTLL